MSAAVPANSFGLREARTLSAQTFVAVDMLYVRMSVNKEAVEAFVDSGAQSTIMGLVCLVDCNI